MSATQLSALSPAANRPQKPVLLKGRGRKNPNLVVTSETKRGNTVPHIYSRMCSQTEKSNVLERLQQTESHMQKLQKTRPGVFHKAEMAYLQRTCFHVIRHTDGLEEKTCARVKDYGML